MPPRLRPTVPALLATALCAALPARAQTPPKPLWELGGVAIGVSQQAYPGSDQQVRRGVVLPYLLYRGKVLRADNDGIGVRPVKTPDYEFDISAAGAFGSGSRDIVARRGMPAIGTLVEAGPRLRWNLGGSPEHGRWRLDLPLRGVFDLSHQFAHRGIVFQPGVSWSRREAGWNYGASASALLADRKLQRTFYEVAPAFATAGRPAYQADGGLLAWRFAATLSRDLTRDWTVFSFARVDSVAGAANRASPLVRQTTGATVGVGVSYTWLRSSEPAQD